MMKVGVLALQGGFAEHIDALHHLGVDAFPVRLPAELESIDAFVFPGGESTTVAKLMRDYSLVDRLNGLIAEGLPVLGTCAGMVLLANKISGNDVHPLGAIDIEVRRNAFGRQVDSFEADIVIPALGQPLYHAVFIRAPLIEKVGDGVEVLANLPDGSPVAVRERNLVAAAFHPELTPDLRFHEYFLALADSKIEARAA
jgi:5'-phosphate synthase pdxT subunit